MRNLAIGEAMPLGDMEAGLTVVRLCDHAGAYCEGAEHCNTCNVQIFSGYKYGDERYCKEHKPATWESEIAEMTEKEFDNQDEMYWCQWEIEDLDCKCPVGCSCRPTPEILQALYDADRERLGCINT